MGLDSIWYMPGEKEICEREDHTFEERLALHPTFDPELKLVGGMFSGNGRQSFRGKAYYEFVEQVTGVSLYQDDIDNATIRKMADALEAHELTPDESRELSYCDRKGEDEFNDLKRMFRTYADAGAFLHGWW
jgi:hypothetical protein